MSGIMKKNFKSICSIFLLLFIVGCQPVSLTFTWTSIGGTQYDIRYSPIMINEQNFNTCSQIPNTLVPKKVGEKETFVTSFQPQTKTYYFAVKVKKGTIWSDISNVAVKTN